MLVFHLNLLLLLPGIAAPWSTSQVAAVAGLQYPRSAPATATNCGLAYLFVFTKSLPICLPIKTWSSEAGVKICSLRKVEEQLADCPSAPVSPVEAESCVAPNQ